MTDVTDLVTTAGEWTSLLLIVASFLVVAFLAYRVKSVRSLQFELFIVLLIITAAEIPEILGDLGIIDVSNIETIGLSIHTVSMIFLTGFIFLRVRRFLK